jgi:hypothetical protein
MVTLLNPFRKNDGPVKPEVVIPLQTVRYNSEGSASGLGADETTGEGEEDNEPLLPSDGLDLERLKSEIERDLVSSGVDSAYDRMSELSYLLRIADMRREIESHQQSHPRYWHGTIPMGVVYSMRHGMAGR